MSVATIPREETPQLPWFIWQKIILHSNRVTVNNLRLVNKEMNHLVLNNTKQLQKTKCTRITFGLDDRGYYMQLETKELLEKDLQQRPELMEKVGVVENAGNEILRKLLLKPRKKIRDYTMQQLWSVQADNVTIFNIGIDRKIDLKWYKGVDTIYFKHIIQDMLDRSVGVFQYVKNIAINTNEDFAPDGIELKNPKDFVALDSILIEGDKNLDNFRLSIDFMKTFAEDERHTFVYTQIVTNYFDFDKKKIICVTKNIDKFFEVFQNNTVKEPERGIIVCHKITILLKSTNIDQEWLSDEGYEYQIIEEEEVVKISFSHDQSPCGIYNKFKDLLSVLEIESNHVFTL